MTTTTPPDTSSKGVLIEKLSILLGFEDGSTDVLDHLLSIESKEDLKDYLQQLLGRDDDDDLNNFVDDVERYKCGESISALPNACSNDKEKDTKTTGKTITPITCTAKVQAIDQKIAAAATVRTSTTNRATTPTKKQQTRNINNNKNNAATPQSKKSATENNSSNSTTSSAKKTTTTTTTTATATATATTNSKKKATPKPPKKGKRKTKVCGCFGNQHKPLTNCLYCGRISCEIEGYDYCPFCSLYIEEFKASPDDDDAATRHKERLLHFDRDFAKRTVLVDDQADYYNNQEGWLSDNERDEARKRDEKRKENLHQRKKQTLNIAF